ncbi:hypothetical protein [Streptomyces silvisoli]
MEVPPLRHHIEDVQELIPFLLVKLTSQAALTCSTAAVRLLMRHTWPGNIAQLRHVLRTVAQRRRSGVIRPGDLPPECQTLSRRVLSPLESLERDAIVRSLLLLAGCPCAVVGPANPGLITRGDLQDLIPVVADRE